MKKGFLIVSRGTLDEDVRSRYLRELELHVEERFENAILKRAFTNGEIRRKLRELTGEKVPGVKAAMLSMKEEGVNDITVLSTHVIAGDDYRQMSEDISGCGSLFERIRVAGPLVEKEQDFDLCARAVHSVFGKHVGDGCLVLMARGAADEDAEETILRLEKSIGERFGGRAYIATLNGSRNLTRVLMDMRRQGRSGHVVVAPFSFIPDELVYFLSSGDNSYEDRLLAQGYEPECIEEGLGINDAFLRLYLKHLYDVIK